jgi:hypothetical protein
VISRTSCCAKKIQQKKGKIDIVDANAYEEMHRRMANEMLVV